MKKMLSTILVIVNIILYLVSFALWISISDEVFLNSVVTIITLVCTVIVVLMNRKSFMSYYMSTQFKGLTSALTTCVLVFCIISLFNYLAFKNPYQVDLSESALNSLRAQSIKVLESVDEEIQLKVFALKKDHLPINDLLKLYRVKKSDIQVEYIDVQTRPDLVKLHSVTKAPTIIVEMKGKSSRITRIRELELTNAIFKISREKETVVCVDSSHTRLSWFSEDANHHSALRGLLELENYRVEDYKLVSSEPLNACDVLVLWGVEIDLDEREILSVNSFLEKGRSLLVGINPKFNGDTIPQFRSYLKQKGILVHNVLALSPSSHIKGSKGTVPIATDYSKKHPILEGFSGIVFFPLSTALDFNRKVIKKGTKLITSSPISWGESDFLTLDKQSFDEGKDLPGPIHFALAHEYKKGGRILTFSNTSFVSNSYRKFTNHFSLFVNSISWLTRNDQLISFERVTMSNEPVFISRPQLGIIFFFSVVFLPIVLIIFSIVIYRRRGKL
ncbi:hypothetical protein A9Q84_03510 [Halobacteriovorax marinus]|uniref:ABC-type uncharacterized transport system domain-containing protein n=1 Tax=Halobacteriovorax marinus TaxID=97084 RepID=A0A1Y5F9Y0_9BACT|nr:hypothetical protein A9Q84_03510 [Halobacteriovorax marinus]